MELIYFSGFKSGLPHSLHVWVLWNQYVSAHGRRQRDGYPRAAQPFIKCKCWQLTHLLWYLLLVQTAKIFNLLEPRPFTSDPRYTKAELFLWFFYSFLDPQEEVPRHGEPGTLQHRAVRDEQKHQETPGHHTCLCCIGTLQCCKRDDTSLSG